MTMFERSVALLLISTASVAAPASAAVHLISADVKGPTGTVWDTTKNSFYTLFLQNPFGSTLNANDQAVDVTLNSTNLDFQAAGDGWPTSTTSGNAPNFNSDPFYTLTLKLTDGSTTKTITGTYTVATDAFVVNDSARFGNLTYSIGDFDWNRSKSNLVGQYSVASKATLAGPGSKFDYQGSFGLTAVPEPAIWGTMIAGFGLIGFQSRRRRAFKAVTA